MTFFSFREFTRIVGASIINDTLKRLNGPQKVLLFTRALSQFSLLLLVVVIFYSLQQCYFQATPQI